VTGSECDDKPKPTPSATRRPVQYGDLYCNFRLSSTGRSTIAEWQHFRVRVMGMYSPYASITLTLN